MDFVGAKHCGDKSVVKAENLHTAMLRPFSVPKVTKEDYIKSGAHLPGEMV
jgi:hypothetical protein